jgi:hypothetical protein
MFAFLRRAQKTKILKDEDAFWAYADATQRIRHTKGDSERDAEERLDLRAAQAMKAFLESVVGPEEGPHPVQMQNWDWNDDRCRRVIVLRSAFRPELIPRLQELLVGDFADFQVLLTITEGWELPAWGSLKLSATEVALQRHVAQAYAIAA